MLGVEPAFKNRHINVVCMRIVMVPDFQSLMLPVLKLAENQEIKMNNAVEALSGQFNLTPEERQQRIPSGTQTLMANRVQWAKTYLKNAGLVTQRRRGFYIATDEGRQILTKQLGRIDIKFLKNYESFKQFIGQNKEDAASDDADTVKAEPIIETYVTPDEQLSAAHKLIEDELADELLNKMRLASPAFFESLLVNLLEAMNYGGAEGSGHTLGQTADNGVDGVIDQDALGVDQIYIQAKRYKEGNNVGAASIRDFFGALNLKKAQKGIFFTTSDFTNNAVQTAKELGVRIVLINGEKLARLMLRYNIGCRDQRVLHLKKIDEDFFIEG